MIISGKQIQDIARVYSEQSKVTNSAKTPKTGPVQRKDEVVLSAQAQEFGQFLQAIRAMPEVREDKVKELAGRLESGNYNIDSKEIAGRIIARLLADRLR